MRWSSFPAQSIIIALMDFGESRVQMIELFPGQRVENLSLLQRLGITYKNKAV